MAKGCPALVLAAGASKRLGQPKALVEIGTTTLVGLAVRRLFAAGCEPVPDQQAAVLPGSWAGGQCQDQSALPDKPYLCHLQ